MTDFLLLAFIFLVAGVLAVPLATKLGLGSVLGYLLAGVIIAPLLTLLHVDVVSIQHFAEFGVVMMLFLVGLELEPKRLWAMRHQLLGLGGLQVLLTTLAFMLIAMLFGMTWQVALAIGLVLALSSTAIVLQTFNEKSLLKSDGGNAGFSILLTQDIAVIPMLAFIPLLATQELLAASHSDHSAEAGHASLSLVAGLSGWQTALITVAAIAFVLFLGSYLTRPLFRFVSSARLRELFTATALMMVIGIALLMSLVGLSPALGTFIAGVVLANSEYRHELEADIEPFKGLLLGVFFITVGAGINFPLLMENLTQVIGFTAILVLVKMSVIFFLASLFRLKGANRWLVALSLAQAGEFGFVLLSFTVASSVIPVNIADLLMLVVALSMLITPVLFIVYDKVIIPLYSQETPQADEIDEQGEVIIIGHGRVGGIVNRMLRGAGYHTTVIDYSSSQLELLRKIGLRVFFGDGTRPDLLHSAGIEQAALLVIAIDDQEKITELARYAVKKFPNLTVIARARNRNHVYDLWSVGCREIIRESYDSSLRMGRTAIEAMGVERDRAQRMADEFETLDRSSMIEVADLYDVNIPPVENEPYMRKVRELMGEWEAQLSGRMQAHHEPDDEGKTK